MLTIDRLEIHVCEIYGAAIVPLLNVKLIETNFSNVTMLHQYSDHKNQGSIRSTARNVQNGIAVSSPIFTADESRQIK